MGNIYTVGPNEALIVSGSSGSVVASRLSENANRKILLVEAGGDPNFASDVPGFLFSTQGYDMDWKYLSEKNQNSCLGMLDQRCPYPRGKVLGGSSTINSMLYVRGNPQDFDEWNRLGNIGWNYENVLHYFKKSQNLNGYNLMDKVTYDVEKGSKGLKMSKVYHSTNGPLSVSPFASASLEDVKQAIFDGFKELNISTHVDINGENQMGISNAPGTLFRGTRANTAKMFLNPFKNRSNLFVVKNAIVKKLIINENKVLGVELLRNGQNKVVEAKKEVVLSAGAINSPQLLLLSGVGPKYHLENLGIPVKLNLKGVGENLQDHFVFLGAPFSISNSKAHVTTPIDVLDAMYAFLTRREGLLSSIGLTDLTGFVDTQTNGTVPDIQYLFIHFSKNDGYLLPEVLRVLRFTDDLKQEYLNLVNDSALLLIAPVLLKPKGRGRIQLQTTNIFDPPLIYANILNEEEDRNALLRGIRLLLKLNDTGSFKAVDGKLRKLKISECKAFDLESEEYWRCLMKYATSSLYHPVGTCKMGPKTDESAVVDDRLRVHGITNLRVADASIMPTIVRGNTNAACIMIGEKCADFIKEEWERHEHAEL